MGQGRKDEGSRFSFSRIPRAGRVLVSLKGLISPFTRVRFPSPRFSSLVFMRVDLLQGSFRPAVFETVVDKEGWQSTSGATPPVPST